MFAISATDAVSPAVQRTRIFLFRPFRLGTYLKLCLVACITEGMGANFQVPGFGHHSSNHQFNFHPSHMLSAGWIAVLVLALMVLGCVLYYPVTRLRFAYFHCLIHNVKEIRPGWRLYRAQATRFFWLNLAVGFCFLLAVVVIALPFVAGFWRLFRKMPQGGHPHIGSLLLLVLPLIPIAFLLVFASIAVNLILRDLMLPHFALQNATAREAWSAVRARIQSEKSSFFVYALLRVLLPVVAWFALILVMILLALLFTAVIVVGVIGFHPILAHVPTTLSWMGVVFAILVGVAIFGIVLVAAIGLNGTLGTAIRQYALLFYGSRYQPLADILWPPPIADASAPEMA